jgi:drug/metabolite transporter (DMT)-like permease
MKPSSTRSESPSLFAICTAFAAVYLIWGSTYLAIRIGVKTIPPFLLGGSRFSFAGPILMMVAAAFGATWPTVRQWRAAAITGGLMLVGGNGLVVLAEREVPSSITALIIATTPVWFALGDWIRPGGQRPSRRAWIGIALGIIGVAYLSFSRSGNTTSLIVPAGGLALLVAATISWAAGSLLVKHLEKPSSPWMMSGAQMTCGGLILLALAAVHGEYHQWRTEAVAKEGWISLGYLVVFGSWIGFSAYVWLLKVSSPSRVSTYAYVNPVVAVVLGWFFLGEELSLHTVIAALVLLSGVAIVVWPSRSIPARPLSKSS